ncbi:solute carrier family 66 member 3 [Lycorma delicatula]|uniref:solute carrier family 66 member 3 n=1 Tax=Lycorma delicatula TaxID=130591 RepID=UPI003F5109E1
MAEVLNVISDILSVITITLCFILKFPQIINIYRLKSASGINIYGLLLELSSYTTTACYNYVNQYALLSYMEYPIIIAQEFILIYLVLKYMDLLNSKSIGIFAAYSAITCGFIFNIIPSSLLTYMIPLCTPVSLSSKALQLWEILWTRKAESVSVTSWLISAFTNFTRVFTIYVDSADAILLTNFILSTALSTLIALSTVILNRKKTK